MTKRAAFTLVELSIVLVILGLLVGGVLSGQSLIRAAELRSVATDKDRFATALYAFRDKYLALPGDMPNAFAFWGAACGTDDTAANDPENACNGNGNGIIRSFSNTENEHLLVWEHLSRAGLIEGSFDGTGTLVSGYLQISASNLPASKLSNHYWLLSSGPCEGCGVPISSGADEDNYRVLAIGALTHPDYTPDPYFLSGGTLTRSEAWNLDKKLDDGLAERGRVLGGHSNGDCGDQTPGGDPDPYRLSAGADAVRECLPHFVI